MLCMGPCSGGGNSWPLIMEARFDHRVVLMAFVLAEVLVGQVVLQFVFSFILSVSLHQYFIFHSSSVITIHS